MKKLLVLLISVLFIGVFITSASAEISATGYSGKKYYEQQVFVSAYNNSGGTIPTNSVVILDSTGTTADSLGAYVTTSIVADSPYVFGVADEDLPTAGTGRVLVRGPHLVRHQGDLTTTTFTAGTTVVGSSGPWATVYGTADGTIGGVLGYAINTSTAATSWVWVAPQIHK